MRQIVFNVLAIRNGGAGRWIIDTIVGVGCGFLVLLVTLDEPSRSYQQLALFVSRHPQTLVSFDGERKSEVYQGSLSILLDSRNQERLDPWRFLRAQERVEVWLLEDPVACINFLYDHGSLGLISEDQLRGAGSTLGRTGVAGLIQGASRIESPIARDKLLIIAFSMAALRNPAEAIENIALVPEHLRDRLFAEFASEWITRDGAPAAVDLLSRSEMPLSAVESGVRALGSKDFERAVDLLVDTPELNRANRHAGVDGTGLFRILFNSASGSPKSKLEGAKRLPPGGFRNEVEAAAAGQLIMSGGLPLETALSDISNTYVRDRVIDEVAYRVGIDDSSRVVALAGMASSLDKQSEILRSAANRYTRLDARQAISWAMTIPDVLPRAAALREVAETWIRKSPKDAFEFLAAEVQSGEGSVFEELAAEVIAKAVEQPRIGTRPFSSAQTSALSPNAKASLRTYLRGRLTEESWRAVSSLF